MQHFLEADEGFGVVKGVVMQFVEDEFFTGNPGRFARCWGGRGVADVVG